MLESNGATDRRREVRQDLRLSCDSTERSLRLLMDARVRHLRILLGTIIADTLFLATLLAKGFHWF